MHKPHLAPWLVFLLTLAASPSLNAQDDPQPKEPPPNIIVILADDLGYSDLACYGRAEHYTPNLDRLAASGIRFTQGYASCPVCSPTRAALLTGRSPARLNLTDWLPGRADRPDQMLKRPVIRQQLPHEEVTLAERLKSAGYRTASVGKWHLGGRDFWPETQGFDLNIAGSHTGSPPGGYFRFQTPTFQAHANDEYLTDRLTDEAIAFITRNRAHPFFLYLPHYAVHIPLQAKKELERLYRENPPTGLSAANPIYAAMIQSLDEGVGRILDSLDELDLRDNTLVLFTSDNGGLSTREGPHTPATNNHPLRAGKGYLYEGGIRVPWIVSWPGHIQPGRVCETPIASVDLLPTLVEITGLAPDPSTPLDGASLAPLWTADNDVRDAVAALDSRPLYWHYPHYSNQGGKPGSAIRVGSLKLIEFYEDNHVELYDLATDPGETQNLASEHPDQAADLLQQLHAWRDRVNARMPTRNPDYAPPSDPRP